jgi:hypothetical protein
MCTPSGLNLADEDPDDEGDDPVKELSLTAVCAINL